MSMFMCAKCGDMKDSDSGCAEAPSPPYFPPYGLLCVECMPDDEGRDGCGAQRSHDKPFSAEQQALIDRWEAEADDGETN